MKRELGCSRVSVAQVWDRKIQIIPETSVSFRKSKAAQVSLPKIETRGCEKNQSTPQIDDKGARKEEKKRDRNENLKKKKKKKKNERKQEDERRQKKKRTKKEKKKKKKTKKNKVTKKVSDD